MKYSEITEGPLQRPNLLKNPARLQALINKIETGSPFTLRGEEMPSVKITQDPELLDNLKKGSATNIVQIAEQIGQYYL